MKKRENKSMHLYVMLGSVLDFLDITLVISFYSITKVES